jgi:hypothetical protein
MSGTTQAEQEAQEAADSRKVIEATDSILKARGISSYKLQPLVHIPASTLRRITNEQEAKLSTLARIERAAGLPLGGFARASGLVVVHDVRTMLASDPNLHPVFQRMAIEHYDTWVKLSTEEFNR